MRRPSLKRLLAQAQKHLLPEFNISIAYAPSATLEKLPPLKRGCVSLAWSRYMPKTKRARILICSPETWPTEAPEPFSTDVVMRKIKHELTHIAFRADKTEEETADRFAAALKP